MVQRKAAVGSQGDKQSDIVRQFMMQTAGAAEPAPAPQVVSSGFIARTESTDAAKEAARTWDRSQLLKVDDNDAQVKIYNACMRPERQRTAFPLFSRLA